jgi:hypothetical protein
VSVASSGECVACSAYYAGPTKTSGLAIAGFVTSFFCGLLGLILSASALGECDRSNGRIGGRGFAVAGVVISIVSMIVGLAIALGRH